MVRTKLITASRGLIGACLLALSWNAQAAPLNLALGENDVASFFIDVSYNSVTDVLSASGFAMRYYDGAASYNIAGGLGARFDLDAVIDSSGNMISGSVAITGTIAGLGYNSGTLLTGTLTEFGFGTGDPLEFRFTPTGGDMLAVFGSVGGIILSQTGFGGSFDSDFANSTAVSDTAVIPVPAAVWLMLSALAGLVGVRRR